VLSGWWLMASTGKVPPPAPITIAAPTAQPAPTAVGADGCLGGSGDPATVVLAAQQAADLTPEGAAGFTLAFIRYGSTYPGDLKLASTLPGIVHPSWLQTALPGMTAHTAGLAAAGVGSGTVPGASDLYRVLSADPSAASITVGFVVHLGQPANTAGQVQMTGTMILDVVNGHWVVAGFNNPPADPVAAIPGAPWQSYTGVC
jgi:hypothetical protein